ncbi:hypothetical protein [Streptomyces sp. NPDC090026]|uniref:hypothetical protein n=1 Tax=Streptomyces sp. NPDC090026 TaxID=3365923 RepID=UPI00382E2815
MPIYLPEPTAEHPADGKGWNRLSLNALMGHGGAQCALLPLTYPAFIDSYNTMRAAWGGYGHCVGQQPGQCAVCPVPTRDEQATELIPVNAPRVLFRVEESYLDGAMFHATRVTRLWPTRSATTAPSSPTRPVCAPTGTGCATWPRLLSSGSPGQ